LRNPESPDLSCENPVGVMKKFLVCLDGQTIVRISLDYLEISQELILSRIYFCKGNPL
jgi:hypothetical protein